MNAVLASAASAAADASASALAQHAAWLRAPHTLAEASNLLVPWLVQLIASWVAFLLYAYIDAEHFAKGADYFHNVKLPTRHPIDRSPLERGHAASGRGSTDFPPLFCGLVRVKSAFAYSQLFMVPLVLFNQCVIWPCVSLLFVWPLWQRREAASGIGAWPWPQQLAALVLLMVVSDHIWYWSHRMLHLPLFWSWAHREHHVAPQAALSATFVHPLEYALFTLAIQMPFALAGFPMVVHAFPLAWGMFTGSGAHSGYSGALANGDEHNAHHLVTDVNFGLIMVADRIYGTHWRPEAKDEAGKAGGSGRARPTERPLWAQSSELTRGIAGEFGSLVVGGIGRADDLFVGAPAVAARAERGAEAHKRSPARRGSSPARRPRL